MHVTRRLFAFLAMLLLLSACAPLGSNSSDPGVVQSPTRNATTTINPAPTSNALAVCPASLGTDCRTPYDMRVAYSVQSLLERGFQGKARQLWILSPMVVLLCNKIWTYSINNSVYTNYS